MFCNLLANHGLHGLLIHDLTGLLQLLHGGTHCIHDDAGMSFRVFIVPLEQVIYCRHRCNGFRVDCRRHGINITNGGDQVNGSQLAHNRTCRADPFRFIFQHKIGIRDFALIGVFCIKDNRRAVEALVHICRVDLHRDLALTIHRVGDARNHGIHDIIGRLRHGFRGLVVRDIALAHGHPRVFHRTAASKNLCDQGNAGGRPIAAVFIFRHKLSP